MLFETCTLDDNCPTCTSGQLDCNSGSNYQCDVVGECVGEFVGSSNSASSQECLQVQKHCRHFRILLIMCFHLNLKACSDSSSCTWYTYHSESSLCLHYSSCELSTTTCPTCLSGQVECAEGFCNVPGVCVGSSISEGYTTTADDCLFVRNYPQSFLKRHSITTCCSFFTKGMSVGTFVCILLLEPYHSVLPVFYLLQ